MIDARCLMSNVCCLMFVAWCVLYFVLFVVCPLLFVCCCVVCVVCCVLLLVVWRSLFVFWLFVDWCVSVVGSGVCCLLFAGYIVLLVAVCSVGRLLCNVLFVVCCL